MEKSMFLEWVQKYFPGITIRIVETLNGEKRQPTYLHRRMLKKEFSVDGKWESVFVNNTLVAADVVAMDSPLPLKKRDAIGKANGEIPKMGIELKLNENQLTALDTLVAKNAPDAQIIAKLFADTPRVIGGIYERNEFIFLEGLSTGVSVVADDKNVGTGIRLDYKYLDANKFTPTISWLSPTATPLSDIRRVLEKAAETDGNPITTIMMDPASYNAMKASQEGKDLYATSIGNFGNTKPVPTTKQFDEVFSSEFSVNIIRVNRTVKTEKNAKQTAFKPWAKGAVVFLTAEEVGDLVWSELAEMNHPVDGVTYNTVDDFILVSKYRKNQPSLGEFTNAQARVVPVIANVDQIYLLSGVLNNPAT
jgi:hypothetical protein